MWECFGAVSLSNTCWFWVCGQVTGFAIRVRLELFLGDVIYVTPILVVFFRELCPSAFVGRDVVFTYFFLFLFFLHTVSWLDLTVEPVVAGFTRGSFSGFSSGWAGALLAMKGRCQCSVPHFGAKTSNSPIQQFKVLHKGQRGF